MAVPGSHPKAVLSSYTVKNIMRPDDQLNELKHFLSSHLAKDRQHHYGDVAQSWITYADAYHGAWDNSEQMFRQNDLERYGFSPGKSKILDLAAGCGQFIQLGALAGYDIWGIEPERWKLDFIKGKFQYLGLSGQDHKILEGLGEDLPFSDNTFDCVSTFQTLEHVQSPLLVLKEMIRVTKPGGGIYIRCPDYRSTFEAHYQLPWVPLFPRWLAKHYLRVLGRPVDGLDSLQYVTKPSILKMLTKLERDRVRLMVFDDTRIHFENALRRRGIPLIPMAFELWGILGWLRNLFRREISVNLLVRVLSK